MADGSATPGTGIMPRSTIAQIVAAKMRAHDAYLAAWDAMRAASDLERIAAPSGNAGSLPWIAAGPRSGRDVLVFDTREAYASHLEKALDQNVWSHVIKSTNLDQLMDRQERDAFREALSSNPPPATVENIAATVERLLGDADLIFKRGIALAFSKLDRRFRSHDGFKIGSRVVLSHAFSEFGTWNHYQRHDETLIDVERVFYGLDGKPQPERYGGIIGAIETGKREASSGLRLGAFEVEGDYFRVVVYKNGNAHLWFTRKDLVLRVNELLADFYGEALGARPDAADVKHAPSGAVARNMGWFPTPEAVVNRVMNEARIWTRDSHAGDYPKLRVLEPSAGEGALALPAARAGHAVLCVELQPARVHHLRMAGLITRDCDFLSLNPDLPALGGKFDRIVMNPPFDRGLDVDHVTHALQFLAPGGTLVAVMAAGVEFREDAKTVAFRREVERRGGRFRDLPAGSFAPATNVNTCLCIIGGRH